MVTAQGKNTLWFSVIRVLHLSLRSLTSHRLPDLAGSQEREKNMEKAFLPLAFLARAKHLSYP